MRTHFRVIKNGLKEFEIESTSMTPNLDTCWCCYDGKFYSTLEEAIAVCKELCAQEDDRCEKECERSKCRDVVWPKVD